MRRLPLLAGELVACDPDVVLLQECAWHAAGHAGALLGARLRYSVTVGEADAEGLAVLTRTPARRSGVVSLEAALYGYPAPIWLDVVLADVELRIVCVHLPLARRGPREPVVRELLASEELSASDVVVVGGDLNMPPEDPLVRAIVQAGFVEVSNGCGATMPNPDPVVRLDYLFVRAAGSPLEVIAANVFGHGADGDGFLPSDHLAVGATVRLRP